MSSFSVILTVLIIFKYKYELVAKPLFVEDDKRGLMQEDRWGVSLMLVFR